MNVCIITVYNSENCGSFLQAYALSEQLKALGHNVFFLERSVKNSSHSMVAVLKECVKSILRLKIKDIGMLMAKHKAFSIKQAAFRVVTESQEALEKIDLFVLGSDTIWNFKDSYFAKYAQRYTGAIITDKPFVFYAASCANTTAEDITCKGIKIDSICAAKAVGVRDNATAELIEKLLGRKTDLVCDPTLLIRREDYDAFQCSKGMADKYLLIYCFGMLGQKRIDEIKEFAKNRNLKIVNIGVYQSWADVCLPATPDIFVSYYRDAECVVTNTFHGTIFSTIFGKDFVVITDKKRKIADYLAQIQMEDRMLGDGDSLKSVLERPLEYDQLANTIGMLRRKSLMFLEEAIN